MIYSAYVTCGTHETLQITVPKSCETFVEKTTRPKTLTVLTRTKDLFLTRHPRLAVSSRGQGGRMLNLPAGSPHPCYIILCELATFASAMSIQCLHTGNDRRAVLPVAAKEVTRHNSTLYAILCTVRTTYDVPWQKTMHIPHDFHLSECAHRASHDRSGRV